MKPLNTLPRSYFYAVLLLVFSSALGIRLAYLNQPWLEFHPARQYANALASRQLAQDIDRPAEQRKYWGKTHWFLEPPLLEFAVAQVWHFLKDTPFWVPRIFSTFFWFVGAFFLWKIICLLGGPKEAWIGSFFYLLFPYGIVVSQSFMVDSLMLCGYLISLYFIIRWITNPQRSFTWLVIVSLLASLIKPGFILFGLLGTFFTLWVGSNHRLSTKHSKTTYVVIYCSCLGIATFLYIKFMLSHWVGLRFYPELLFSINFWKGWFLQLDTLFGPWVLVMALIGSVFLTPLARKALLGMILGYIVFGISNTDLFSRLDHYHLSIVPAVALLFGLTGKSILNGLLSNASSMAMRGALAGAVLFSFGFTLREGRLLLIHVSPEIQKGKQKTAPVNMSSEIKAYQEIGETVGHSQKTIFLTHSYGHPLMFHAQIQGAPWLKRGDEYFLALNNQKPKTQNFESRWLEGLKKNPLDYFIVTDFLEWDRQKDLQDYVSQNYFLLKQTADFIIFDLNHSRTK